ncbi:MAG: glycosyltransferase [bacterium]|nr:glycosyltransferase [bacterium]
MKKICWIGPVIDDNKIHNLKAHSAAANLWQLNFINAIKDLGIEVVILSYLPERTWPMGKMYVSKSILKHEPALNVNYVSYLNLKGIRDNWIAKAHINSNLSKYEIGEFDLVVTYNPLKSHRIIANKLKSKNIALKWISILADDDVSGNPDLTVFLSSKYYESYDQGPKLYLEGGIQDNDITYTEPQTNPPYLVYAGSQTPVTGIREFVELYSKLEKPFFHLYIYGQGNDERIKRLVSQSNYIHLGGFVSSEELEKRCSKASGFVSPRSNSEEANTTFPSKILYYLQFEKPIISSANASIDSRYDDFLYRYHTDNPTELNALLEKIKSLESEHICKKIQVFKENNSWKKRVKELLEAINKYK